MPIHDWKRVPAGVFHGFHQHWTVEIELALNRGILPPPYYAFIEQASSGRFPDVLTFHGQRPTAATDGNGSSISKANGGLLTLAEAPPRVSITAVIEADAYAQKANRVVVLNDADEVVAVLEIAPGNKSNLDGFNQFVEKALQFIRSGIHFFFVDLFPPTSRDPQGLHAAIWSEMVEYTFQLPDGKPLTAASYSCGVRKQAFVEALAVGDDLSVMPLFLQADRYVQVPLETTYQSAFDALPSRWREVLDD